MPGLVLELSFISHKMKVRYGVDKRYRKFQNVL